MPRLRSQSRETIVERAMHYFWRHGFEATSVDALVKSIGISRQGLYGDFGGKEALFAACLETYSREVVSPAFAQVEAAGATIKAIAGYSSSRSGVARPPASRGPAA